MTENDLKEVPSDSIEAVLFQIIDDISTAGDMFKPKIDAYFRYVQSKIESASSVITSDGYKLYYAEQRKLRLSNERP